MFVKSSQSLLASKRDELSKMPLDDMHPSQVRVFLHTVDITSDDDENGHDRQR
jgi:hypothetical protein